MRCQKEHIRGFYRIRCDMPTDHKGHHYTINDKVDNVVCFWVCKQCDKSKRVGSFWDIYGPSAVSAIIRDTPCHG
jgi:hypothetical protein